MTLRIAFVKSKHWADKERVYVIPFSVDKNGIDKILVRNEPDSITGRVVTVVGGGRDNKDGQTDLWHLNAAKRELFEESGFDVDPSKLELIGTRRFKSHDKVDYIYCVDVTGLKAGKPITDGSKWEKDSKNEWVSVEDFKKLVENGSDLALITSAAKFFFEHDMVKSVLAKTNVSNKPMHSDLGGNAKVGSRTPFHKYEDRVEVAPGVYKYDYKGKENKEGGGGSRGPQPLKDQQVEMFEQIKMVMMQDPYASKLTRFFQPQDYSAIVAILYARGLQPDENTILDEINIIKQLLGPKGNEYMPSNMLAEAFRDVFRRASRNPEQYINETIELKQQEVDLEQESDPLIIALTNNVGVDKEKAMLILNDSSAMELFAVTAVDAMKSFVGKNPQFRDKFKKIIDTYGADNA